MSDTIFALSSAPGRAGVAVVRVSGGAARDAVRALAGALPAPRQATLRTLKSADGAVLDQALVLWFAGPESFTGEDVAEFQVHGGRATVERLLAALGALPGLRPAAPGEFTRRAVEAGKLDLTQAEALIDLIDADTEGQRRQAMRQYGGALASLYDDWRARLIGALAWAEAEIDFADEEFPDDVFAQLRKKTLQIKDEIDSHLSDARRGEIVRDGFFLTVIGPPNAGKSSLINALAKRDVAIVAETAGTTRDIIEVRLDIGGYAVIVADTAGLHETADAVENEGVRRALARAEQSDLVLLLLDGTSDTPPPRDADLVVWNKADLPGFRARDGLALSLKKGDGLGKLLIELGEIVSSRMAAATEAPVLSRVRHRHALEEAVAALTRAVPVPEPELFAEDVRLAVRAIGRITGRIDVEDLLDVIFRDFCIGK